MNDVPQELFDLIKEYNQTFAGIERISRMEVYPPIMKTILFVTDSQPIEWEGDEVYNFTLGIEQLPKDIYRIGYNELHFYKTSDIARFLRERIKVMNEHRTE